MDFDPWLRQWQLVADGDPIVTHSSRLLLVRRGETAAMLKIAAEPDEIFGGSVMEWWDGDGAAKVFARAGHALLLERAEGSRSLLEMALAGEDDEASRIMCRVADRLHAPRDKPLPDLVPLPHWFRALEPAADRYGGLFPRSAAIARDLLAMPQEVCVLHGDIHHENVLDFGTRGWLAIDPKGLLGERGFDYANILCNPELKTVISPGRFLRQLGVVAEAARLERQRLLRWVIAYAGLSAAWFLDDGMAADSDLAVMEMALAELEGS